MTNQESSKTRGLFCGWLIEGESGKRWCVIIGFIAWNLQLASLLGCDFLRMNFTLDTVTKTAYPTAYLGFFRRRVTEAALEADGAEYNGSTCVRYGDDEHDIYQEKSHTNCATLGVCISGLVVIYLILSRFGVVRHKNIHGIMLTIASFAAGIFMGITQGFTRTNVLCTQEYYQFWDNPDFEEFKNFSGCTRGVSGRVGLAGCLMWFGVSILLLCNVLFSNALKEIARKTKLEQTKQSRAEYLATYGEDKTYDQARPTEAMKSNNMVRPEKSRSTEKVVPTFPIPANPNSEGTDDPASLVGFRTLPVPISEIVLSDDGSDEHSINVPGDEENTGEPIAPFIDEGILSTAGTSIASPSRQTEQEIPPGSPDQRFFDSMGEEGLSLGDSTNYVDDDNLSFAETQHTGLESTGQFVDDDISSSDAYQTRIN